MSTTITIRDTTPTGQLEHELKLVFQTSVVTVEDLIRARVCQEVESYNEEKPNYFRSLVQPVEAERLLNDPKLRKRKQIDVEQQYYLALDFFQKNGFFILVDDQQVTELSTEISLKENSQVTFIKLTPLVGG
ncbi:MAG: hypothetical protein DHS20C18_09440 [Saprospiraceae bacterium]|nr:MAG: hypothetical protein DHS20C18_09440 [Saprospiraceae bacterium]